MNRRQLLKAFTHQLEAAEADIVSFAKLFPMNARPVQKLDRRFVLSSDT